MRKTQVKLDAFTGQLTMGTFNNSGNTYTDFVGTPGSTEDRNAGYYRNDKIYTTTGETYFCIDDSIGDALWVDINLTLDDLGALAMEDALNHSELNSINPNDHHIRYADSEAKAAVTKSDVGLGNVPNEDATDPDSWDQKGAVNRNALRWDSTNTKWMPDTWEQTEYNIGIVSDGVISIDVANGYSQSVIIDTVNANLQLLNVSNLDVYKECCLTVTFSGVDIDDVTGWELDDGFDVTSLTGVTTAVLLMTHFDSTSWLSIEQLQA